MHSPQLNPYQPPEAIADATAGRPTLVRYGVLAFLCTLALLLYIDRVCIGQAATSIRDSLTLSETDMGWVFNAFILAYCIFEVPTGHWGDRFGSRRVITRIVLWWSAFTALTGAAFGLWPLVATRFLFGAGEAGAFPNAARVVTRWFPPGERGFARGAITTTSQLGGAITPPLAAFFINHVGWRWTFVIFGLAGVAWAVAFYRWFRDEPGEHAAVNPQELRHIGKHESAAAGDHHAIPWGRVVASPNVWLLGTIMTVGATLFYMLFQWYPTYLKDARGLSEQVSGWFSFIALAGGSVGCITGGLLSDQIIRRTTERKWTRRLCGGGMLCLAAVCLFGVRYSESPLAGALLCGGALFCLQVSIPTWWTVVSEISGRQGAAMFGLMNGMGGLGVMVLNAMVGRLIDAGKAAGTPLVDCWRPVFDGVAIGLVVGAICWLLVDATRPIVPRHAE
ncbi:MAG: MFS transporter [Planctomycetaceae bacterium]|nr:MFS transporter [Planctomycetaceae bacterium]